MDLNKIENEGKWSEQTTRLNSNFNKISQETESLKSTYKALTQSAVLVVSTLPAEGKAYTIYRVVGISSYSDYMYNPDDLSTPILMATYNNAIDTEPTADSHNLVESNGVFDAINEALGEVSFHYPSNVAPQNFSDEEKGMIRENAGLENYNTFMEKDFTSGYYNTNEVVVNQRMPQLVLLSSDVYKYKVIQVNAGSTIKVYGANYAANSVLYVVVRKSDNLVIQEAASSLNTINNPAVITVEYDSWVLVQCAFGGQYNYTGKVVYYDSYPIPQDIKYVSEYAYVNSSPILTDSQFTLPANTVMWYGKSITISQDLVVNRPVQSVSLIVYNATTQSLYEMKPLKEIRLADDDIPIALVKWGDRVLDGNFINYYYNQNLIIFKQKDELSNAVNALSFTATTASRGVHIDYKMSPSNPVGGNHIYTQNNYRDSIIITLPDKSDYLALSGVDLYEDGDVPPHVPVFFYSALGTPSADIYIGVNRTGAIPEGAKMAVVSVLRSKNSSYDNLVVSFDSSKTDGESVLYSRGIYIDHNHLCNISQQGIASYVENALWDCAWVVFPSNASGFVVNNLSYGSAPPLLFYLNEISAPTTFYDKDTGTGNILMSQRYREDGNVNYIIGTKMVCINLQKEYYPNGYKDLSVEYIYPTKVEGGYEVKRNCLISVDVHGVFQAYQQSNKFDNIWIEVPEGAKSIVITGDPYPDNQSEETFTITRYHYLKEYGTPTSESYMNNNTDGIIPNDAKMISLTISHLANAGSDSGVVNYDDFGYTFVSDEKESTAIKNKLLKVTVNTVSGVLQIRGDISSSKSAIIQMTPYSSSIDAMCPYKIFVGDKSLEDSKLTNEDNYLVLINKDLVSAIRVPHYYYMYQQHGYAGIELRKNNHGLTQDDVGAIYYYDDNGTNRHFKIVGISGNSIFFIPAKINGTPDWEFSFNTMPTQFVYESGGIHTATIVKESGDSVLRHDFKIQDKVERHFLADGVEIDSGTYYCDSFSVNEVLRGYDATTIENWYPNVVFNGDFALFMSSFNFYGMALTFNRTINFLASFTLPGIYGWMPFAFMNRTNLVDGNSTAYSFLPKTQKSIIRNGVTYRTDNPFPIGEVTDEQVAIKCNVGDVYDLDNLPERVVSYLKVNNSNHYIAGLGAGHSLLRGITKTNVRKDNIVSNSNVVTLNPDLNNKFYAYMFNNYKEITSATIFEHTGYLSLFDPNVNDGQVYVYKEGGKFVVYCHCQNANPKLGITLPSYCEGLSVDAVIENSNGASILTNTVTSGKIYVGFPNVNNNANYIVFTLSTNTQTN